MTRAILACCTAVLLAVPAQSHKAPSGWEYPMGECCNGTDCAPIPETDVKLMPDGSYMVIATKEVFLMPGVPAKWPVKNFRWSPDQSFHRCAPPSGARTWCLFVPRPST